MTILRAPVAWSRPKNRRGPDLSPDETQHVKAALRFLAKRHGSQAALAEAMGLKLSTVKYAAKARGSVSAGVALRAARAARFQVEDILSGAFPKLGACPHCARGVTPCAPDGTVHAWPRSAGLRWTRKRT